MLDFLNLLNTLKEFSNNKEEQMYELNVQYTICSKFQDLVVIHTHKFRKTKLNYINIKK